MPYNFVADSFHTKKLRSRLLIAENLISRVFSFVNTVRPFGAILHANMYYWIFAPKFHVTFGWYSCLQTLYCSKCVQCNMKANMGCHWVLSWGLWSGRTVTSSGSSSTTGCLVPWLLQRSVSVRLQSAVLARAILSVCLSHCGIVSRRMKIWSCGFQHLVGQFL